MTRIRSKWQSNEVKENNLSLYAASRTFKIPLGSLHRFLNQSDLPTSGGRYTQILPGELETMLIVYCEDASNRFLGLDTLSIRQLAYDVAKANNINCPQSWEAKRSAGKDWFLNFLHRHPALSLRKPELTSIARASAFNETMVGKFFDILRDLYNRYGFEPGRIYNVDETGISTTQVPSKVISKKGQKQVGKVVSQEKGKTITAVCCVSATGHFVPPMFIFPRLRSKKALLNGSPNGSIQGCQPSGWINIDLFVDWLKHFQRNVQASKESPVLLLLDNYSNHLSYASVEFCKEHHIEMMSFPPHCSHKLQPLDRTVFRSLKIALSKACDDWMACHPGRAVTEYDVGAIFNTAYKKAATITNDINGFSCTGIYPLNSNIFEETDFAKSITTARLDEEGDNQEESCPTNLARDQILENINNGGIDTDPMEGSNCLPSTSSTVTSEDVRPFPIQVRRKNTKKRKSVLPKWLTGSNLETSSASTASSKKKRNARCATQIGKTPDWNG